MIITIANSKGGSGKSTISINLATKLALDSKDVLVIDTDEQRSVEKFCNIRSDKDINQLFTCASKSGSALTDTIKQMVSKYDVILIDTKATINTEQKKAMLISDFVIMPTTTSQIDLSELLNMFEIVSNIKDINDDLKSFIVLNRINPNPFLCNEPEDLKNFIESYTKENELQDITILDSIIHDRIDYKRSIAKGLGVCELDNENSCNKEFSTFYDELISKIESKG